MSNDHPFGNPNPDPAEAALLKEPSIVDTILNLDELLSSDVRRAEKSARFCVQPWIEAEIEELHAELDGLTDDMGRPLDEGGESSVADGGGRTAFVVAEEIRVKQHEYAAAFRTVRVRQMPADDWTAFEERHKDSITKGAPYPPEMFDELIAACAVAPRFTVEQARALRAKVGHPQVNEIALAAWNVCTQSGVSIPKSQLSSAVLKRARREQS